MASDNFEEIEKRISTEEQRLTEIYAAIEIKKKKTITGIIRRAAFMRISLEDLESELNIYGFTEYFSQGDQEPYQRERPIARIYSAMNSGYQKIIKQLTDLLPKDDAGEDEPDEFEMFCNAGGNKKT